MSLIRSINLAIESGDKDKYRELINAATKEELLKYESSGLFKITPLDKAAEMGDIDALHLLLAKGIDINTRFFDGNAAIHYIMLIRDPQKRNKALDFIVACGADVNLPSNDEFKLTPLHQCVNRISLPGYYDTFERLASVTSLDVNAVDGRGLKPLDCVSTQTALADRLKQLHAKTGEHAIHYAYGPHRGKYIWRNPLQNPDSDGKSHRPGEEHDEQYKQQTQEQIKAYQDEYEKARQAHVVANTETGATHYLQAIQENNVEKINLYLQINTLPLVTDKILDTVYHYAAFANNKLVLETLYKRFTQYNYNPFPAHFELQNRYGNTSLHVAVIAARVECIVFLLQSGCSYSIHNNYRQTALLLIQSNPALLDKLMQTNLPHNIKNVLAGKEVEMQKVSQFHSSIFNKNQNSDEISQEVEMLHKTVTKGVINSKKISPMVNMLLTKKSPNVLEAYATSLSESENRSQKVIVELIQLVRDMVKEMEKSLNTSPRC